MTTTAQAPIPSAFHRQFGSKTGVQPTFGPQRDVPSPHESQKMFPNGHVSSRGPDGYFECLVPFDRDELRRFAKSVNPNCQEELDWDICLRATGSSQLAHRQITRVGSLPDGTVMFHLRFSDFATPTEDVGDVLEECFPAYRTIAVGHAAVDAATQGVARNTSR